mgnify:CR=1 FL=1
MRAMPLMMPGLEALSAPRRVLVRSVGGPEGLMASTPLALALEAAGHDVRLGAEGPSDWATYVNEWYADLARDTGVDEPAQGFVLTVADDGPGMAEDTLAQAFDRYFTTKSSGTGLGLALVRDTVNEAGGQLEVFTREGRGTRFDVWLPLAGSVNLSMRPPRVSSASSGILPKPLMVDLRVLVVDDDAGMRSLMRTALEIQGARVVDADGYAAALEREGPFELALVDLNLGDGRGDALLERLRREDRVQRAVLLSGSTDVELGAQGEPDAVLRKPFELEELHLVIERVLGTSSRVAEEEEAEG